MFTADRQLLSFRTLAIMPILFFLPPIVSFAVDPGAVWAEYPGILFHLSILFLISRMDAPQWARAAGTGWVILDVLTGVLVIHGLPTEITWPVRLAAHLLAGIWIVTASLIARWRPIQVVGTLAGSWLALYTLGSAVLPQPLLGPASILTIVWLGLLAAGYEPAQAPRPSATA
ncbi:hypothetical protein [Streptomyces prasinus]|uniref:hypothetical protein n=1 Tax=Streptomyces prasinus TaxID=67345 RepID=UPI0033AC780A